MRPASSSNLAPSPIPGCAADRFWTSQRRSVFGETQVLIIGRGGAGVTAVSARCIVPMAPNNAAPVVGPRWGTYCSN